MSRAVAAPLGKMPEAVASSAGPAILAALHVVLKDDRTGAGLADYNVGEGRSIAHIVDHAQREVVGRIRFQPANHKGFGSAGLLGYRLAHCLLCALPIFRCERRCRIAHVIAIGLAGRAVVACRRPGQRHLGQQQRRNGQIAHRRGRRLVLFHGVKDVETAIGDGGFACIGQRIDAGQNTLADLVAIQFRVLRRDQGHRAGHMRRCHGGAADNGIARRIAQGAGSLGHGRIDGRTGRGQIDRGAVVAEVGVQVAVICGRHREDIGQIERGRVAGNVAVGVARRADMQRLFRPGHCVFQRFRGRAPAPTVVGRDNVDALLILELIHIVETLHRVGHCAAAAGAQELTGDNAHFLVDADDAEGVVALRADDTGHMRAVAVVIHRVAAVGNGIDAIEIIHIAVVVVVHPVRYTIAVPLGTFGLVHPHIGA